MWERDEKKGRRKNGRKLKWRRKNSKEERDWTLGEEIKREKEKKEKK